MIRNLLGKSKAFFFEKVVTKSKIIDAILDERERSSGAPVLKQSINSDDKDLAETNEFFFVGLTLNLIHFTKWKISYRHKKFTWV